MERNQNITTPKTRCAIYTRKSTEEGLEQEFNSLDAQREAGESYIQSQRHEGWTIMPERYDDGGYSGGTLDRPALERLLEDIEEGKIDCVVVYKVDRLSRSLLDFAKIIETFDRNNVSFVSVTQQFNTTTSMGRLTLNILLSFAQFEREIIGERIRDKVAAAKKRGKYMGGTPPLGYDVDSEKHRLIINPEEAKIVKHIFKRFIETGSPITVAHELNKKKITTKSWTTKKGSFREGNTWNRMHIYRLLYNHTYLGEVSHKGTTYPGEHEAIIGKDLWSRAHAIIEENKHSHTHHAWAKAPSLLKGIIRCGACESAMSPVSTTNRGRIYRYYQCGKASKHGYNTCPVRSVSAGEIEAAVIGQLRSVFRSPEMVAQTFRAAKQIEVEESLSNNIITEQDVAECLRKLDPIWAELYPLEQERIVRLLVEQVTINTDGMKISIRAGGLHSLASELKDTQGVVWK